MRGGLTRRMIVASGLLGLMVSAAFAGLLISVADLRAAAQSARLSERVLVAINRLERLVVDVEAGERGFLITGQDDRLNLWRTAQAVLPGQAATLERLVADNPEQLARARQISLDIASYVRDYSIPTVAAARQDLAAARTERVVAEGALRIDAIRAEFDRFMATEQDLAVERQSVSGTAGRRANVAAVGGLAGSIVLIVVFAGYLSRAIVRPVRSAAAMAGRLADGELGARLPESGTGEIGLLERSFNTMAGSLQESRLELAASRTRIVAAADQERRRIERDLHDGVQQRLVSLVLDVRAAEATVPPGLVELRTLLAGLADGLTGSTDELRELSRGIHPAILTEGGLRPALKALGRRSAVPVELDVVVPARLPEQVEVAAYYLVSEALTNTAKHAQATIVDIGVRVRDGKVRLRVSDDGIGGAAPGHGSGLIGLIDRIEALGGTISVSSPVGEGTVLVADLPVESR